MIIFGSNDLGKVRSLVVWSVDSYKVTSPIYLILYYICNSISELTHAVIIVRQCEKRVDTAGYSKLSRNRRICRQKINMFNIFFKFCRIWDLFKRWKKS